MKKTTNVLPLNVQTDTLYGRQTHGRFSSNQDILKLILNINIGLISSMMHKIFASLAYRRVRGHVKYEHLHSAKDSKTHRNDEVGEWWELHCKFIDPCFQVWSRLSGESCSLFQKQNKTNPMNPQIPTVFSILFCFRDDWRNAYACDFLLQMSEGWRYLTQCLAKCTESVTIETSMSNT